MRHPRTTFAPIELSPAIRRNLRPVKYGGRSPYKGRVWEIVGWKSWPIAKQIAFIRTFIESTAKDPALAELARDIVVTAGVKARDNASQWAALLEYVQNEVYYVNERDERLQSPQFTLSKRLGDCDDKVILLTALGDALRLDWRLVISGVRGRDGVKVRWIEGTPGPPPGVKWTHIYGLGGWPAFQPARWAFMEATLSVPFGWDVIDRSDANAGGKARKGSRYLPELGALDQRAALGFTTSIGADAQITIEGNRDPGVPGVAGEKEEWAPLHFVVKLPWQEILVATIPSVLSALALQYLLSRAEARADARAAASRGGTINNPARRRRRRKRRVHRRAA